MKDLEEGNRRSKWTDREPYAFWKGNPKVAKTREDLLKCNVSETQDWNARLFSQVLINVFFFLSFFPVIVITCSVLGREVIN